MAEQEEQRVCVKFCQKLGHTFPETYGMIQKAFEDEAMSPTSTYEWYRRFKEGRTSTKSDERSGRPSTSRNEVFFDHKGVVHHEYAPHGQTVNKEYYLEVLARLRDAVRRKRPDLWVQGGWQLHHNNAPAHASHVVQSFLAKHNIVQVPHPPYSPDMAPCDFWLFPKLKNPLKGQRFQDRNEIQANATRQLNNIPENAFQKCYQQWQERLQKCVDAEGSYFEGD